MTADSSSDSESSSTPHRHERSSKEAHARLLSEVQLLRKEKSEREASDRKQELMKKGLCSYC